MTVLENLGVALGLAGLAGVNLYLTVLLIGLAVRFGWITLAADYSHLQVLADPWIIGLAATLYAVEFFADKIPWVDSLWDAFHTFIRPIGGAAIAIMVLGEPNPVFDVFVGLLAGGVAFTTHAAKAGTRLTANASPEPFSNIGLSLAGDGVVVAGLGLTALHPVIMLGLTLLVCAAVLCFLPTLGRQIRAIVCFASSKLNLPAEETTEHSGLDRLPARVRTKLPEASPSMALPCWSRKIRHVPANLRGWLVLGSDGNLHLVFRSWRGLLQRKLPTHEAILSQEVGFLSDRLILEIPGQTSRWVVATERRHRTLAQALIQKTTPAGSEQTLSPAPEESVA